MPQDAFTLNFISKELASLLTGGKISKITQQGKDLLTFIIYTRKGSVKLEICLSAKGCRVNLSDGEVIAPKVAPGFCMLLRKHLQNAEITRVGQVDGERIIFFDFDCTSEFELTKMTLYAELMGKYSNAVLTQNGVIVGALKSTAIGESTKRVLFTGAKYTLPEPQDKIEPNDLKGIKELFENRAGDRAKIIADGVRGVSYATALDILTAYGEEVSAEQAFNYLNSKDIEPCVVFADGEPIDFKVRSFSTDKKLYGDILSAQTAYYARVTEKANFADKVRKLQGALSSSVKKLEKRRAVMEQKLLDCDGLENIKLKGELITANIYLIERGAESFEAVNYYDEAGAKIKIALDRSLSPADNAQKYFKRYAKLKRTVTSVTEQKRETEERLNYLYSISSHLNLAENLCDLEEIEEELKILNILKDDKKDKKKVEKTLPFRSFVCGGFRIIAGRNNVQNDRLLKSLAPDDLWLHTQGYHSAHVGIICGGKTVPDEVLKTACEICAFYSDGRYGTKIPVDYVKRAQVKKPPKANAGFVIYNGYKTALAEPNAHAGLRQE
ncbi:MAG: fibronectin/fibrinogen-binding protein [Clostridia bacterium]|nr:fibronectin/fibrinogen-binding protein [Clostridia bacterium]